LNGLIVIKSAISEDERGFFLESFRADKFEEMGIPYEFVQENHSGSIKNVIRGLHFQWSPPLGKLMRVTQGTVYLMAVDIRKGSPTLGQWYGVEASKENRLQVWAPAGFARGFGVLSDYAEVQYKCTGVWNPQTESEILWNDPSIGIPWPIKRPILSPKDRNAQTLETWLTKQESDNFTFS
jgi:dTDP-4-dehydrorhamnose 3,5-epimerase